MRMCGVALKVHTYADGLSCWWVFSDHMPCGRPWKKHDIRTYIHVHTYNVVRIQYTCTHAVDQKWLTTKCQADKSWEVCVKFSSHAQHRRHNVTRSSHNNVSFKATKLAIAWRPTLAAVVILGIGTANCSFQRTLLLAAFTQTKYHRSGLVIFPSYVVSGIS